MTEIMRSPRLSMRGVALALALFAGTTAGTQVAMAQSDKTSAPPTDAARPASQPINPAADPATDPGRAWAQFLETADFSSSMAAYKVLSELSYTQTDVDADACAQHRDALAASIRKVPISIALHRAAMLCAEAAHDDATAERELAAVAALSKLALAERGGTMGRPIRVFLLWDIYALLNSLGYEFRYEYFEKMRPERYFPHIVAVWDPKKKTERHFEFDYIDVAATISRDDPLAIYPYHRNRLSQMYLQSLLENDELIAYDLDAVLKASEEDDDNERLKLLRAGAARGGIQSAMTWMLLCRLREIPGCSDGLVDALLPQAEKGYVVPKTLLAVAYATGIGLRKDRATAEKMLAAADANWQPHAASVYFVRTMRQFEEGRLSKDDERILRSAASAGNGEAESLRVMLGVFADTRKPLGAAEIALLQGPESNALGLGWSVIASHYEATGREEEMRDAVRRSAEAGLPAMQQIYADFLFKEASDPKSLAEARAMMVRAAQGGDVDAMRALALESARQSDWAAAAAWLQAAVDADDIDAILDLAGLIEESERPGINGKPEDAFDLYSKISKTSYGARARRGMARMAVRGVGTARDPVKAMAWLRFDAEDGDTSSQTLLGAGLLGGEFGSVDIPNGTRWLKQAIAAGDNDAKSMYGSWLIKYGPDRASRSEGRKLLTDVEAVDDEFARNNLAWALCVSPYDDVREPKAGLEFAKRMEAQTFALDFAALDTVAACYAANRDFARAVDLQKKAIALLPKQDDGKPQSNTGAYTGVFRRSDMYGAGQAYIEANPAENKE